MPTQMPTALRSAIGAMAVIVWLTSGCSSSIKNQATSSSLLVTSGQGSLKAAQPSCPHDLYPFLLAHYPELMDELQAGQGRLMSAALRRARLVPKSSDFLAAGRKLARTAQSPEDFACQWSASLGVPP